MLFVGVSEFFSFTLYRIGFCSVTRFVPSREHKNRSENWTCHFGMRCVSHLSVRFSLDLIYTIPDIFRTVVKTIAGVSSVYAMLDIFHAVVKTIADRHSV